VLAQSSPRNQETRRQWDICFEHGDSVDSLSPNSDVVHIVLAPAALAAFGSLGADRDLLLWRHWVEIPPETTAADAETGSTGNGYMIVCASTVHANCPPVYGLCRATCRLEAWVITPIAFSVRSEVTYFVDLEMGGWIGSLVARSAAARRALHAPFLERLGALGLYANYKHGVLAVPLPRAMGGEADGDGDDAAASSDAGPAVRTFQPATGLADDIYTPVTDVSYMLKPVPMVGGVDGFSQPKAEMFRVRSKNYLNDRVKLPSAPAALDIAAIMAFQSHEAVRHIAAQPDSPLHRWRAQGTCPAFVFVVNMMIVGNPGFQGVFWFGMSEEEWGIHKAACAKPGRPQTPSDSFHKLLAEFVKPDFSPEANRFRDERFKLLPAVVQGPMLLKNSSGNRPAILGNKLRQSYYSGDGYFEVDVDCTTSRAAASVVNMVKGYCSTLVIDLAFILQGNSEEELPERILGLVRFSRVNMSALILRPKNPPAYQPPQGAQAAGGGTAHGAPSTGGQHSRTASSGS